MKTKLVLLLIAAVGSTALVASAQTPSRICHHDRQVGRGAGCPRPGRGAGAAAAAGRPARTGRIRANAPMRHAFYGARPQVFSFSVDENNLSHQAEQFAQQLAAARSDSDREKIKSQLTDLLEKQFDQRQKRHEDEIKQLEAQIKKLKDTGQQAAREPPRDHRRPPQPDRQGVAGAGMVVA